MEHKHHIIPKYMGGTNDPNNIKVLSIEGHANAHKELYENHGHWQDKVAWLGLAKIITHEEAVKMACSEAGKIGSKITNEKFPKGTRDDWDMKSYKGERFKGKIYKLVELNGIIIEIQGLVNWCKENNLHYSNMNSVINNKRKSYGGYTNAN